MVVESIIHTYNFIFYHVFAKIQDLSIIFVGDRGGNCGRVRDGAEN